MRLLVPLAAIGVFITLIVSTPAQRTDSRPERLSGTIVRKTAYEPPVPHFRDATLEAGIAFTHLQGDEHLTGLNETLGPGACAFDFDNDGWVDLFLVNGTGQTRYYGPQHWWHVAKGHALYRNLGNGRFEDVTQRAGLNAQSWGMGCLAADLDNDGDSDLLITNYGTNLLYRNNGDGTFTDVTQSAGVAGNAWSTSAAAADYDGDGLLDIYVANYLDYRKGARTYEAGSQFYPDMPVTFNPQLYVGAPNTLYRNLGGLRFEEVTEAAGVANASGRSLAAIWLDANEDGRLDLLVANDIGTTNVLYVNRGDGRFEEAGASYLLNEAGGTHGLAAADVNMNGRFDLVASTNPGRPPAVLLNIADDGTGSPYKYRFRDRARFIGIEAKDSAELSGWGIGVHDFNNDGYPDLFMASGRVIPDPDSKRLPLGQQKRLWLSVAKGRLRDATAAAGVALRDTQSARGIAFADFDNDGDIDVYVAHNNGLGQLLINEAPKTHWLGVKLTGTRSNRDAIGARLTVRTLDGTYMRMVGAEQGFLSTSDRRLHVGLGEASKILDLEVLWPDGRTSRHGSVPVDTYIELTQGKRGYRLLPQAEPASPPAPTLGLQIAAGEPLNRCEYLRWLVKSKGLTASLAELGAALGDPDPRVRGTVLEILGERRKPEALPLAVRALEDRDPALRVAAIEVLRRLEDEASVRWLLRLFRDPESRVRTAVASTFEFFFREEEAVIHGKFLALPHLIRLLDDPASSARVAAARALGEAERSRAVDALVARLDDADVAARAAYVRALGLIREKKAVPAVRKVFEDTEQPPLVRAQALVALKRLNAGDLDLLEGMLRASNDPVGKEPLLRLAREILADKLDGVVLNQGRLLSLLKRHRPGHENPSLMLAYIEALVASESPTVLPELASFAGHADPTVRELGHRGLILIDKAQRPRRTSAALADPDLQVRRRLAEFIHTHGFPVSAEAVLKNVALAEVRPAIPPLFSLLSGSEGVEALLRIAGDSTYPPDPRLAALGALNNMAGPKPVVPNELLNHPDPSFRAAALAYWGQTLPVFTNAHEPPPPLKAALADPSQQVHRTAIDIALKRHEAWAKAAILQLLRDRDLDPELRLRIIGGGALSPAPEVRSAMMAIAADKNAKLRLAALRALAGAKDKRAEEVLWEILRDEGDSDDARFLAARALYPRHGDAVIEILRQG